MPELGYTLRPAEAQDQAAISALVRSSGINPLGLDWRRFLVAVDEDGRVLACGQVKLHRDGSRELASIAVVPDWRRRGLARAIIEALLAEAEWPLWLTCRGELAPFYARFGFVQVDDRAEMPPHFRRLDHLARLFLRLTRKADTLAIMRL